MDNFFTGSKINVADLMDKPNFELIRHDVTEDFRVEVTSSALSDFVGQSQRSAARSVLLSRMSQV